jgi:polyisoprenoid-binding protein YceI
MATWVIDSDHAVAAFAARHMMVTWVRGQFNKITGSLSFDPGNIAASAVEVELDASGIYTGVEKRDNHLKSADFLNVEQYPTITFKSTKVEPVGLDQAWVHGDLTLRGVTRPVVLDVRWAGPARFDDEGTIYTTFGFRAETKINREDFGMDWNTELEQGGFMVGKHVYLTLEAEADLVEE